MRERARKNEVFGIKSKGSEQRGEGEGANLLKKQVACDERKSNTYVLSRQHVCSGVAVVDFSMLNHQSQEGLIEMPSEGECKSTQMEF